MRRQAELSRAPARSTSGVIRSAAADTTAWSISGLFCGRPRYARTPTAAASSTHRPGAHTSATMPRQERHRGRSGHQAEQPGTHPVLADPRHRRVRLLVAGRDRVHPQLVALPVEHPPPAVVDGQRQAARRARPRCGPGTSGYARRGTPRDGRRAWPPRSRRVAGLGLRQPAGDDRPALRRPLPRMRRIRLAGPDEV